MKILSSKRNKNFESFKSAIQAGIKKMIDLFLCRGRKINAFKYFISIHTRRRISRHEKKTIMIFSDVRSTFNNYASNHERQAMTPKNARRMGF